MACFCEDKGEAYKEWADFMASYFIINNKEEKMKYNYVLLSTDHKMWTHKECQHDG